MTDLESLVKPAFDAAANGRLVFVSAELFDHQRRLEVVATMGAKTIRRGLWQNLGGTLHPDAIRELAGRAATEMLA